MTIGRPTGARTAERPVVVDPQRRLRFCAAGFALLLSIVFARTVQLEWTQGEAFRVEATRPRQRERSTIGARGRILSHDGQTLACDREVVALAIHYRYLEEPPDAAWLRRAARAGLSKADRNNAEKLAAAQLRVLDERRALAERLARLSGLPAETWRQRAASIQQRVERIADSVNRRRDAQAARPKADDDAPQSRAGYAARAIRETLRAGMDEPPPPPLVVSEQLDYHVIVEDLAPAAVAQVEADPEDFPGTRLVKLPQRFYPGGALAANVLGHLGPAEADELESHDDERPAYQADRLVGRAGLERQYDDLLRGRRGQYLETIDHSGRTLVSLEQRAAAAGRDLVLTLDARLQRAAEQLLDSALERQAVLSGQYAATGGAIVVLDVRDGAVRAAATAPRFDPNPFARRHRDDLAAVLDDPARPLFDRTLQMAIPPGSVFKTLTALVLVQARAIDPDETFFCQGYLRRPDQQRCEIFVREGKGHGDVTLCDALAQSCNVYFFAHADGMGPQPLVEWATRLGIGRPTGVDLPGEAAGLLPCPENITALEGHAWRATDTQALAIGQGSLTTTPLQIARLMAAVANGGQLVAPHVVGGVVQESPGDEGADPDTAEMVRIPAPQPIAGLRGRTLEVVREGLRAVVADDRGTAHGSVWLDSISVAGKTGTAETGGNRPPHAWFAGYTPADRPKLAFVVVLEHGGSGAVVAGAVAKRLVEQMQQLGLL